MKKVLLGVAAVFACTVAVSGLTSCGPSAGSEWKVAMITDYGDITDESFNQATYEGAKSWCESNDVEFTYYKPTDNTDAERIKSIELAADNGYNLIIMPGYAFAPAIDATAEDYPEVKFVALDVAKGDLLAAHFGADYNYNPDDPLWAGYVLPSNVYCAVYQEELAGYMAGYAAVKEGFTKLGFLGGMAVPAVVRYGYGFVQGCDDAAAGAAIEIKYVYGNQFFGDNDITTYVSNWYASGTEIIFACGGGIYTSAGEAASNNGGKKVIGVDVDQKATIDGQYGAGTCVTSAMKGLAATVKAKLTEIITEETFVSKIETLGLVSGTDVEANYVQLPTATWSMTNFTVNDYKALVADLFDGTITVSASIAAAPEVAATTSVTYFGNIK
ncbi:MAG TPA: BMP family ABC transporter substrate-binding protein [Bacilli bacterium]|nr:BMP family ABC transporter substrate-binding protein [Bacilli bacterium]